MNVSQFALILPSDYDDLRSNLRDWMEAHVPSGLSSITDPAGFAARRDWERVLDEAGLAAIDWPTSVGGRGMDAMSLLIFAEEYVRASGPERINGIGRDLAGPTIRAFGTDAQKQRFLPSILRSDEIWCQGFSEPDAGSDLASLRTRGVFKGDHYEVTGQKIWTSFAHFADWMIALVRTEDAPRHRGITCMLIDMRSEGVEVRPIVQLNGDPKFCEVFLTDVKVPLQMLVGEPGQGWQVSMTTLGLERALGNHALFSSTLRNVADRAAASGASCDPVIRDKLAGLFVDAEVFRAHVYRIVNEAQAGVSGSALPVLSKLYWSQLKAAIHQLGYDIQVGDGINDLNSNFPAEGELSDYWYARASLIYAGTNEIQRDIISTRVLGLPREDR